MWIISAVKTLTHFLKTLNKKKHTEKNVEICLFRIKVLVFIKIYFSLMGIKLNLKNKNFTH